MNIFFCKPWTWCSMNTFNPEHIFLQIHLIMIIFCMDAFNHSTYFPYSYLYIKQWNKYFHRHTLYHGTHISIDIHWTMEHISRDTKNHGIYFSQHTLNHGNLQLTMEHTFFKTYIKPWKWNTFFRTFINHGNLQLTMEHIFQNIHWTMETYNKQWNIFFYRHFTASTYLFWILKKDLPTSKHEKKFAFDAVYVMWNIFLKLDTCDGHTFFSYKK